MTRAMRALTLVELRLFVREPAAIGFTLALPLFLLLVNNGADGTRPDPQLGGEMPLDVAQASLLVFVVATAGIMGLSEAIASERERGVLRRLSLAPLRPSSVLLAHGACQLVIAAVGAVLVCGTAALAFGASAPTDAVRAAGLVVLAALVAAAIGAAIGAVAPTTRTAQAVASAVYFPTLFLSGAAVAREALPDVARRVGDGLPLTYAVEGLRAAWAGAPLEAEAVLVPLGTLLVAGLVCVRGFRWT